MTSNVIYKGGLRTVSEHMRSGVKIMSDAPIDNQGRGEAFSPTDLLATSLASCMITIMGIRARESDWDLTGLKADVNKVMGSNPRRVVTIEIAMKMPLGLEPGQRIVLEKAALGCPVAQSLSSELEQKVQFIYED